MASFHYSNRNSGLQTSILEKYGPQIGEIAQHEVNMDLSIVDTSDRYYRIFSEVIKRRPELVKHDPPRFLEIACYRHVLSYRLATERGFDSTLFDVSDYDLAAGMEIAEHIGYRTSAERVAGEFHDLPFSDGYFDMAYVSAALHHTRNTEQVVGEAMRVVADGGHFYCQREPVERMFCFYKFPGNRAGGYTAFERHLADRDLTRAICSPFPGARNAIVFGRVENDRITLDKWYAAFRPHGVVVEELLYHEGLLTALDKEIIGAADALTEPDLSTFISDRLSAEVELASPKLTRHDELLGHGLPDDNEISEMARRVASELKARNPDPGSRAWRQSMARIFGASARFLVQRKRGDGLRHDHKFRRPTTVRGPVRLDNAAYDGISFWERLLPDLTTIKDEELDALFPKRDWVVAVRNKGRTVMGARAGSATLTPNLRVPAAVAIRYRVILDESVSVVRLKAYCGGHEVSDELIPQNEDRTLKLIVEAGGEVRLQLCDEAGSPLDLPMRIRIGVVQAVPVTGRTGSD